MSRSFSIAVSFNLVSMISTSVTLLISTIILVLSIKSLIYKYDVSVLLCVNTYIGIFGFSLFLLIDNVHMLKGDYGIYVGQETLNCRLHGYIMYVFLSVVMNVFALQSVFRLCRVVYSTYIWLQKSSTYIVLLLLLWILSFLLILPVHIWFDIKLMIDENVCLLTTKSARGLIWCTVNIYALPMIIINSVYLKMAQYIHRAPIIVSSRTKRDVIVIRRIVLVLIMLVLIGSPTVIMMLMLPYTKVVEPLFYRISSLTMSVFMATLTLALIYTSPQLQDIIIHLIKKNQVEHINIQNYNKCTVIITKK